MKNIYVLLVGALLLFTYASNAQRVYLSHGGEIILSGADVENNGVNVNTNMRFTIFPHLQNSINFDLTDNIGLFTGVNLSNVNSITLGLRSVTGGTGMLYFDDIRLYPPAP